MKSKTVKKTLCPKCFRELKTYPEGHKLKDEIFICYYCESVFERQSDDSIKESKRLTVI